MDQQPKIPTLKDASKPQVKIKGLGAGLTLFERLKQFKKKDLAFILAGLGTLFMAPLAEHFMMAPEGGDAALQQGWGGGAGAGRGNNLFGGGSSPYESGNNSIASGGAIGGSSDIITPLNARDPSALVMGPGAAQQPPAGSAAPATPPPGAGRSETDYKDALAGAAGRAASAAVKRSPLPVPKVALGGSGLRGLGAAGGGSSASSSLAPINSGNLGQAGTGGGGLNLVRSAPNFRSAVGPRGPNNPEGLDGTKKAAANAGDAFSRSGSALGGLNAAANEQIPTGGSGFGGGGQGGAGANDKAPGGSGPGGNKSVGESLAFLAMKQRQEEALKLEFEKKKLKDKDLLLYAIRNDVLKAMAGEIGSKALTPALLALMNPKTYGIGDTSIPGFFCADGAFYPDSSTSFCLADGKYLGQPTGKDGACMARTPTITCTPGSKTGAAEDKAKSKTETAPSSAGNVMAGLAPEPGASAAAGLKQFCTDLESEIKEQRSALGSSRGANTSAQSKINAATAMKEEVAKMISARDALYGVSTDNSCGAEGLRSDKSSYEHHGTAIAVLLGEGSLLGSLFHNVGAGIPGLIKLVDKPEGEVDDRAIKEAREQYTKAGEMLAKAKAKIATFNSNGDAPFNTSEFTAADVKFKNLVSGAIAARKGIIQYAKDEETLLTQLEPLIVGAEFAGDKDHFPTVPAVITINGHFAAMAKRAEAVTGEKVGAGVVNEADSSVASVVQTPEAVKQEVWDKNRAAQDAIGKAGQAVALMERSKTEAAAMTPPASYVPTAAEKGPLNAAWIALGEMQKKQIAVLSDLSGRLTELKNGTTPATSVAAAAPAGATPAVAPATATQDTVTP